MTGRCFALGPKALCRYQTRELRLRGLMGGTKRPFLRLCHVPLLGKQKKASTMKVNAFLLLLAKASRRSKELLATTSKHRQTTQAQQCER